MIPRPSYMGAGTRSSPISIDDSEEEVFLELYQNSNKSSPQNPIPPLPEDRSRNMNLIPPIATLDAFHWSPESSHTVRADKKRKRENSFTSQDGPVASSSNGPRGHPTLVNRLSQPESKKARKRRRKAERQALEEARLQNIDWLNNRNVFHATPHSSLPPVPSWTMESLSYPRGPISYSPRDTPDPGDILPSYFGTALPGHRMQSPRNTPPPPPDDYIVAHPDVLSYRYSYEDLADPLLYEEISHPLPPPSTSSDWVSSMTMAADYPYSQSGSLGKSPQWSPLTPQAPLPPVPPPPMPPTPPSNASTTIAAHTSIPKPAVEHHALPPKPAPSQPVVPIGMKPDQDPNSKHGIFHITTSTKEAGSDMRKRSPSYIPNPARTLVMEQLPKSHRQPDFINKWSRLACGAVPVHIFIDGPNAKALIEFATAEQARKAWASPKLGSAISGLKPHQIKGRPREDLIKVWWYRVDGVGAGAGVGEIEEGEIEGDAFVEKESEVQPKKETKKERKARLAREREDKRQRELATRRVQEQQQQRQVPPQLFNHPEVQIHMGNLGIPPLSAQGSTMPLVYPYIVNQPLPSRSYSPVRTPPLLPHYPHFLWDLPSSRRSTSNAHNNKSAFGASLQDSMDDRESIASSAGRSGSPGMGLASSAVASTSGQGTEQYDDEDVVDMEVDTDELSPVMVSQLQLPATNPVHRSLPVRPNVGVATQPSRPPPAKPPPPHPSATAQVFVPRSIHNAPPASQKPAPLPVDNKPPQAPAPRVQESLPNLSKYPSASQAMPSTNRPAPPIITPQPKHPHSRPNFASIESLASSSSSATAMLPASASSASSLSASSSSTPVPSEPKAMKNAPTEPSFTKRSLLARQKELEEKIARSKMELAAATAASKPGTPAASSVQTPPVVKPAMDLGEKQALEDRLRKLVLQSRRPSKPAQQQQQQQPPPPNNVTISVPTSLSSTNEPAAKTAVASEKPAARKSSTVAVSTHSFSLEDMAVSFITQTIETMKSQPASVAESPLPAPAPAPAPSAPKVVGSQVDVRLELAAKQKLLEDHISESKMLMSQLSLARTKEAKDNIMRTMREKTRLFEEASSGKMNMTQSKTTTTTQQFRITRWPASCEDAGVLILSDDEDEFEDD